MCGRTERRRRRRRPAPGGLATKGSPDDIAEAIGNACGHDLTQYDQSFLRKTVEKRLEAVHVTGLPGYTDLISHDPGEVEELLAALTVSYSEFFRDPLAFAILEGVVLPELARGGLRASRREVRVWSAACAAGEEAWSVAILLQDLADSLEDDLEYRIFATDLQEECLETALRAVYDERAVRNVRAGQLARHFRRRCRSYEVSAPLRGGVDFSPFDLMDQSAICVPASIFGDFDLVLCCNVLFYYRPAVQRAIVSRMRRCLAPRGYLMTGEAERSIVQQVGGFASVAGLAPVFRKVACAGGIARGRRMAPCSGEG